MTTHAIKCGIRPLLERKYTNSAKDEGVADAYGGLPISPAVIFNGRDGNIVKQDLWRARKEDFEMTFVKPWDGAAQPT